MRPRLVVVPVVVAAVLLVTGCAQTSVAVAWDAPQWPSTRLQHGDVPAPLDAAAVPGLVGERLRNDTVGVQARWMRLPGDAPLNTRLTDEVRAVVAARSDASGSEYQPEVFPVDAALGARSCVPGSTSMPVGDLLADPALAPHGDEGSGAEGTAVVCDVVFAAGPYLGQRLRTVTAAAGIVGADTTETYFADIASGEIVTSAQLWTEGAPAALWTDVVELLRRESGSLSLAAIAPPDAEGLARLSDALDRALPLTGGAVALELAAGLSAPELNALGITATADPVSVVVPDAAGRGLLTPFGAAVLAAAGAPFDAPPMIDAGFEVVDCDWVPCVAVTYDDGPDSATPVILDAARDHRVAVSFFVQGNAVRALPEVAARAVDEGHLVENHTWSHPALPTLKPEEVRDQILRTNAAIRTATGEPARVFRPPYGDYNPMVLHEAGMAAILWDVDTNDWRGPADTELIRRAVDGPQPGSIVLQHDVQANTRRTVAEVYQGLRDRGFTLVNLRQLFGGQLPRSGVWSHD